MKFVIHAVTFLILLSACEKADEPQALVTPEHLSDTNRESASSDPDGFFTLSMDGPIEHEQFGVRLIAVGPNFATILSTKDNSSDTAYRGEYFENFGRIGLRLVRTEPETKSALMRRNILH